MADRWRLQPADRRVLELTDAGENIVHFPARKALANAGAGLTLPPTSWIRWTALDKAAVVVGVRDGTLRLSEAYDRYMLSGEELSHWEAAFDQHGIAGLRAKHRLK
jgi:hypothetical protein